MTSVAGAVAAATTKLAQAGLPEPRTEAELLLAALLGCDRGGIATRRPDPLDAALAAIYDAQVGRRAGREPLQHILGVQEFYGLELGCDRRALVPRPETEGLVDAALALELPVGSRVVDLGTGSACIAIALAVRRPDLRLHALDRSRAALAQAGENARRLGVERSIEFHHGEMAALPEAWNGMIDAVLSNPPYVSEAEWSRLAPEVRDHDPREALVAGPSGLEAYTVLAPAAARALRTGGALLLEIGWGQAAQVTEIVRRAGFSGVSVEPDLRGVPRVLRARR
jgi:release factor glutamine methyltransferase